MMSIYITPGSFAEKLSWSLKYTRKYTPLLRAVEGAYHPSTKYIRPLVIEVGAAPIAPVVSNIGCAGTTGIGWLATPPPAVEPVAVLMPTDKPGEWMTVLFAEYAAPAPVDMKPYAQPDAW